VCEPLRALRLVLGPAVRVHSNSLPARLAAYCPNHPAAAPAPVPSPSPLSPLLAADESKRVHAAVNRPKCTI
jgi:hypothetical protein